MKYIKPNMPIQVYLDSCDYSIFSDEKKLSSSPNIKEYYDKLIGWVHEGSIEIRFSIITLLEITHKISSAKTYAINRAEVIDKLCQQKTFSDHLTLELLDGINLIKYKKSSHIDSFDISYAYKNDGDCMPLASFDHAEIKKIFQDSLKESLKELDIPRNMRRSKEKEFIKNGKFTANAIEIILANKNDISDLFTNKGIPIDDSKNLKLLFRNLLLKRITPEEFSKDFRLTISDVVSFVSWGLESVDGGIDRLGFLRKLGEDNIVKIKQSFEHFQELKVLGQIEGLTEKETMAKANANLNGHKFINMRKGYINELWDKKNTINRYGVVNKNDWNIYVVNSKIGEFPSFDAFGDIFEQYFIKNVYTFHNQRKLKESDYIDMLHCRFMPYVHIFKCDGYMKPMISKIAKPYKTTVVSKLSEVIQEIENRLNII